MLSRHSDKPSLFSRSGLFFDDTIPAPARGILLALVSTALFTVVGVLVRILSETIDVFQILFFRQLVFVMVLMPSMLRTMDKLLKPKMVKLHLFRVTGAFVALYLGFVTVGNIPLADATALGFTQVLFVAVVSRMFLAESVNMTRIITILVGFCGVML